MTPSDEKPGDLDRERLQELHDALDRLELYFRREAPDYGPGDVNPLDLVLRLRRKLIESSARSDRRTQ